MMTIEGVAAVIEAGQAGGAEGGAAGGAPAGGAPAGGTPAGGTGEGAASGPPAWMTGLADEYRNDPDLNRYQTIDDLAKGLKETRAWARGRVPIPTDEAGFRELGEKLRPAEASAYELPTIEGDDGALADSFRAFAFEQGLPAAWAKSTAEFFNTFQQDQLSRLSQANTDGLRAVELEHGAEGYNRRIEAVGNMLKDAGIADVGPLAAALEHMAGMKDGKSGAEAAMRALFTLAERTGELGKVNPADVAMRMGAMDPVRAQAEIDRLMGDKEFLAKAKIKGSAEAQRWNDLNAAAAAR